MYLCVLLAACGAETVDRFGPSQFRIAGDVDGNLVDASLDASTDACARDCAMSDAAQGCTSDQDCVPPQPHCHLPTGRCRAWAPLDGATPDAQPGDGGSGDAGEAGNMEEDGGAPQPEAGGCMGATVLLLFEHSRSLDDAWGSTTQVQGARNAVRSAIAASSDWLSAGALFFPTESCTETPLPLSYSAVASIDDYPQIGFSAASEFLTAWDAKWDSNDSTGYGTPLRETFDRAALALADGASGSSLVLLVTDDEGGSYCSAALGVPTEEETRRVSEWAAEGVATHIVSLAEAAPTHLADIAEAAGTPLIEPDTPTALEATLASLFEEAACPSR